MAVPVSPTTTPQVHGKFVVLEHTIETLNETIAEKDAELSGLRRSLQREAKRADRMGFVVMAIFLFALSTFVWGAFSGADTSPSNGIGGPSNMGKIADNDIFLLSTKTLKRFVKKNILSPGAAAKLYSEKLVSKDMQLPPKPSSVNSRHDTPLLAAEQHASVPENVASSSSPLRMIVNAITIASCLHMMGIVVVSCGYVIIQVIAYDEFFKSWKGSERERKYRELVNATGRPSARKMANAIYTNAQRPYIVRLMAISLCFFAMFHYTGELLLASSHTFLGSVVLILGTLIACDFGRSLFAFLFGRIGTLQAYKVVFWHLLRTITNVELPSDSRPDEVRHVVQQIALQSGIVGITALSYYNTTVNFPGFIFLFIGALYTFVFAGALLLEPPQPEFRRWSRKFDPMVTVLALGISFGAVFCLSSTTTVININDEQVLTACFVVSLSSISLVLPFLMATWMCNWSGEYPCHADTLVDETMSGENFPLFCALMAMNALLLFLGVAMDSLFPVLYSLVWTPFSIFPVFFYFGSHPRLRFRTERAPRRFIAVISITGIWLLVVNDLLFKGDRGLDKYALSILAWTGMGRVLVLAFASLTRFAVACVAFGCTTTLLLNLPKKSNVKYYTSWVLAVLVSVYMRTEDSSAVFSVYALMSLHAFSGAHSYTDFRRELRSGTVAGVLIWVFNGLRMQSISPSKLVHFAGNVVVAVSIAFGLYTAQNTGLTELAELPKRCCGLAVSMLVLYYATIMQNMTSAVTAILCIYGFVVAGCVALRTPPSATAFIFSLCGFLTIYSAMQLQNSFSAVSGALEASMPGFIQSGMVFLFGDGANRQPFELFVVQTVVSCARQLLTF